MPSLAQQIAAVRMRKSPEQIARSIADGRRRQAAFRAKVTDQRAPGSLMDAGFVKQLEARRAAVDAGNTRRPDPHARIAALRAEGKLPPVEGDGTDRPEYATTYSPRDALQRLLGQAPEAQDKVAYEPTPEEILGDEALPKPTAPAAPPKVADADCPPADEVLRGAADSAYLPGDLTPDELAEIDRLNPRQAAVASATAAPVARPSRPVHTGKQRQRGR